MKASHDLLERIGRLADDIDESMRASDDFAMSAVVDIRNELRAIFTAVAGDNQGCGKYHQRATVKGDSMSRKLKAEIEKVEQELTALNLVKAHLIAGHTEADIVKEMDVLSTVHQRMLAAMPAAGEPKPERKKRTPKSLPRPNGKGKEVVV